MRSVAAIFWNREEARLRALWRILVFALAYVLSLTAVAIVTLLLPQSPPADWASRIASHGVAVLSAWLACRYLDRRRFVDLGFFFERAWWLDGLFGLGLGALLMGSVFAVASTAGWIQYHVSSAPVSGLPLVAALALTLVYCATVGVWEETVFRGYLLRNLAEGLRCQRLLPRAALWLSALLCALLFAAAHQPAAETQLLATVNMLLAGMLLAVCVICTRRLALPIGFHIAWNFFQGGVFGFGVSGQSLAAALVTIDDHGPALLTGGRYGPEGGLAGTAALLAGLVLVVLWIRVREGGLTAQTLLTEYRPAGAGAT